MKKRQPRAGKPRKTRQNHVPKQNPLIHEWDRRLLQAGYHIPTPHRSHGIPEKIAAALTLAGILALIVIVALVLHLPNKQPNPWQSQTTATDHR